MRNLKRLIVFVAVLCASFVFALGSAFAAEGTTGDVTWEYDEGILWIRGSGNMADYSSWKDTPWYDYAYDIKAIHVDDSVKHIGDCAFEGCYYAEEITIGRNVESIGYCAFYQATWYSKGVDLVVPQGVNSIGDYAFQQCYGLEDVWIKSKPNDDLIIGTGAFKECTGIKNLAIGRPVVEENSITIGYEAFENCEKLQNIFLARSITSIGEQAFEDVPSCKVYYGGSDEQFDAISIDYYNDAVVDATKILLTDLYTYCCDEDSWWLEAKKDKSWEFSNPPFNFLNHLYDYKFEDKAGGHDAYAHWAVFPDGSDAKAPGAAKYVYYTFHTFKDGRCTACGEESPLEEVCYVDENGDTCILNEPYSILNTGVSDTLNTGWYVCNEQINYGSTRLQVKGDVKIVLLDHQGIRAEEGIHVCSGATLTIYSESIDTSEGNGMGYVNADSIDDFRVLNAGIGGDAWDSGCTIIICGGNVVAKGGRGAAGIGAGYQQNNVTVKIYNGRVTGHGLFKSERKESGGGAGIGGGGYHSKNIEVYIYDGWVYGNSVRGWGSGIGSGSNGCNAYVEIRGGDINAESEYGACVGSGGTDFEQSPSDCTVEIYGGDFHLNPINNNTKGIGAGINSKGTVHDHTQIGSMVSQGTLWIIVAVVVLALVVVAIIINKKKNKNVVA